MSKVHRTKLSYPDAEDKYPAPRPYPEAGDKYPAPRPYPRGYQGYFETPFPPDSSYLAGRIQASVHEHGGVEPNNIIRTDTDWYVYLKWSLVGSLMPLICGKWCLHLFLESMGPAPELKLPDRGHEIYVPVNPCGNGKYKYRFKVPRGTVKPEHCSTPYKLVVAITYLNKCGKPGCIAGFVEGPMLQFYEAHHNEYPEEGYPENGYPVEEYPKEEYPKEEYPETPPSHHSK